MGEDHDIQRREGVGACYTCGEQVGSEHTPTCPRRAWGELVQPAMTSWRWHPTAQQEATRIARNCDQACITVEPAADGTFAAYSDDVPGLGVAGAESPQEALRVFMQALTFHRAGEEDARADELTGRDRIEARLRGALSMEGWSLREPGLGPFVHAVAGEIERMAVGGQPVASDALPPVPALIEPVDADAFAKLEAVASRAAHRAVMAAAPGMGGWPLAELVENEVRAALRAFVS